MTHKMASLDFLKSLRTHMVHSCIHLTHTYDHRCILKTLEIHQRPTWDLSRLVAPFDDPQLDPQGLIEPSRSSRGDMKDLRETHSVKWVDSEDFKIIQ